MKALLLDQKVLRGIGNIYADESLFRARLHPARIARKSDERSSLLALHGAVRQVLAEAIRFARLLHFRLRRFRGQARRIPIPASRVPA